MGRNAVVALTGLLLSAAVAGAQPVSPHPTPTGAPHATSGAQAPGTAKWEVTGTVLETVDAMAYTYVHVDTGSEKLWFAAPRTEVKVGDTVFLPRGAPMANFYSKSLDRTFERVQFAEFMRVGSGEPPQDAAAMEPVRPREQCDLGEAPEGAIDLSGIERPEGGSTVGEVLASAASLAGRQVTVRGKVFKIACQIMGRNWIHVRDGTADPKGNADLIVTTAAVAEIGTTVLVTGTVAVDRDFGFGYHYDVLVEDASLTSE